MSDNLDRSQAQEARVAKRAGGRVQPRSGAGWARKNDVRTGRFLIECKRTDNKRSITLHATDLEALRRNAIRDSRIGTLQFDLNGRSYYVLSEVDFEELFGDAELRS